MGLDRALQGYKKVVTGVARCFLALQEVFIRLYGFPKGLVKGLRDDSNSS